MTQNHDFGACTNAVREIAAFIGLSYGFWPGVRDYMEQRSIFEPDIQRALKNCEVSGMQPCPGAIKYWLTGKDIDGRILRMVVIVLYDLPLIEIETVTI